MATGNILLWPGEITLPDGTTNNGFARAQMAKSSGAPPTNGPNLFFTELLFAGAAPDEHVFLPAFNLPPDYASGGALNILWKRASGTGAANVVWKGAVAALTPGAAEVPNTKVMGTVATVTTAAGTTAQAMILSTITLNMDSAAIGDYVMPMLGRDADNAADTLDSVDAQVGVVWFSYTTA